MKAKSLSVLLLAMYCATIVGCKKENNTQVSRIVSTKETVLYLDDEDVEIGGYFIGEYIWTS